MRGHSPKLLSRVLHELIYEHKPFDDRNLRLGSGRHVQPRPPMLTDSPLHRQPMGAPLCATGRCPGCGKWLISAVRSDNGELFAAWCTSACRERHE